MSPGQPEDRRAEEDARRSEDSSHVGDGNGLARERSWQAMEHAVERGGVELAVHGQRLADVGLDGRDVQALQPPGRVSEDVHVGVEKGDRAAVRQAGSYQEVASPGTGYFLERAALPDGSPVTLLDPNVHVLEHASRRLQRLDITTVEADVCKPLPVEGPFDSAALNGVLHCLPGPLARKAAAVANVAAVLAPTGVLFGASILGPSGRHTRLSRSILKANNRRGTFDNLGDTQEGLGKILEASFERVELETVGSMAIFAATDPRSQPSTGMAP